MKIHSTLFPISATIIASPPSPANVGCICGAAEQGPSYTYHDLIKAVYRYVVLPIPSFERFNKNPLTPDRAPRSTNIAPPQTFETDGIGYESYHPEKSGRAVNRIA